jgi:hypothetical protein
MYNAKRLFRLWGTTMEYDSWISALQEGHISITFPDINTNYRIFVFLQQEWVSPIRTPLFSWRCASVRRRVLYCTTQFDLFGICARRYTLTYETDRRATISPPAMLNADRPNKMQNANVSRSPLERHFSWDEFAHRGNHTVACITHTHIL